MVAGVTRLSAYGKEDFYLSYRPQITFWKAVYKRHTFFTFEAIEQNFVSRPDFGGSYTSILSAHGDLITDVILVIKLPPITPAPPLQVRWVENVGVAMIKSVEFEINGIIVDTFNGEWIRLWTELCGSRKRPQTHGSHRRGLTHMFGLHEPFQESLEGRTLYVPLPFWFTKSPGQSFPISTINTHEVRINVDFEPIENVLQFGPTHSIPIQESQVYFTPGTYLTQGSDAMGIYFRFDEDTKRLYYNAVFGEFSVGPQDVSKYYSTSLIESTADSLYCTPVGPAIDSQLGKTLPYTLRQRFHLGQGTTLLTQFIFLGAEEKRYFGRTRHDYVIEQLQTFSVSNLQKRQTIRVLARRVCSELVWVAKRSAHTLACGFPFHYQNNPRDPYIRSPLLSSSTLIMNSLEVWSDDTDGSLQLFMHHPPDQNRLPGIQVYSFAINPSDNQPSGTVNMSHIERVYLNLVRTDAKWPVTVNVYARSYNVLVIEKGRAQLLF